MLAALVWRGRSSAGLCLKKPTGFRWKPTCACGDVDNISTLTTIDVCSKLTPVRWPSKACTFPQELLQWAKQAEADRFDRHDGEVLWAHNVRRACTVRSMRMSIHQAGALLMWLVKQEAMHACRCMRGPGTH